MCLKNHLLFSLLPSAGTIFFSAVGKSGFVACRHPRLPRRLGALSPADVLVLLSKPGNADELLKLIPNTRSRGCFLISVTSVKGNFLEGACDMNVHLRVERELCPFDPAPVTSAVIQMVFGDTVTIALMQAKGLTKEDYSGKHPSRPDWEMPHL